MHPEKKKKVNAWLIIGVLVLIILLLVWLTIASFMGDTDVAAFNDTVKPLGDMSDFFAIFAA